MCYEYPQYMQDSLLDMGWVLEWMKWVELGSLSLLYGIQRMKVHVSLNWEFFHSIHIHIVLNGGFEPSSVLACKFLYHVCIAQALKVQASSIMSMTSTNPSVQNSLSLMLSMTNSGPYSQEVSEGGLHECLICMYVYMCNICMHTFKHTCIHTFPGEACPQAPQEIFRN